MEIAIFGGSFNPPTVAHELITEACLKLPDIDQVWLMPSGERTDKHYDTSDNDRLTMVELMRREIRDDEQRLSTCMIELELPRPTETARTVAVLRRLHQSHRFWFLYGADAYIDMPNWLDGLALQRQLSLILVERDGIELPLSPSIRTLPPQPELGGMSFTAIRERVIHGRSIAGWVCDSVAHYIADRKLYIPHPTVSES